MSIEKPRRSFSFKKEDYHLPHKSKERQHAKRLISYGIKHNRPPKDVLQSLKAKGLGYRKKNFLHDYAKAHATERSKTDGAYKRASHFFRGVERYKKKADKVITWHVATKKVSALNEGKLMAAGALTAESIEELRALQDSSDEYIFGCSPNASY